MSVTWFTFAILAIAALVIGKQIWKGINGGIIPSLLTLISSLLGVIIGLAVSHILSSALGDSLISILRDEVFDGEYVGGSAGMEALIRGFGEMLMGAVFFTFLFFFVRGLSRCILQMIYNRVSTDEEDVFVDSVVADNSKKQKTRRAFGGILGAVSGVIAMAVISAPIMGTLRTLSGAVSVIDSSGEYVWEFVDMDAEAVHEIDKYSEDLAGTVFYCLGGGLVFRASATAKINGKNVSLPGEMEDISKSVADLMAVLPIFEEPDPVTKKEKKKLDSLCNNLDGSHTMKYVSAEFVSQCSEAWLMGDDYFGVAAPDFGDVLGPVFKDILRVCQDTDAAYISEDMRSFFNVYVIIVNSGFIDSNYDILLNDLSDAEGFVEEIEAEIERNPRLASVKQSLQNTAMRVIAEQIHLPEYNSKDYSDLMSNLATSINLVRNEGGTSLETQQRKLSGYTHEYMNEFGADMSQDMASMASGVLLEQFADKEGDVQASDVDEFFKSILG